MHRKGKALAKTNGPPADTMLVSHSLPTHLQESLAQEQNMFAAGSAQSSISTPNHICCLRGSAPAVSLSNWEQQLCGIRLIEMLCKYPSSSSRLRQQLASTGLDSDSNICEPGVLDEAIVPTDLNLLYTQDLRQIVDQNLPKGVKFTMIAGSPLSLLDLVLPYARPLQPCHP